MARSNPKSTELKSGQSIKAGKKKLYQEPPPPNPEKKLARERGMQQFISPVALSQPATKIVFDKKAQKFVYKLYAQPVDFIYDEDRKQFVMSPKKEDKDG